MNVDVLAIGAHPDDVDIICGGTLAKLAARGKSVAILDLTRGELGTRGTPEMRQSEALAAAAVLGVCERVMLDLGDATLQDNLESRRQVIEVVRRLRPRLILTHHWHDQHPDHVATSSIVRSVMYTAGFPNYPAAGEPFRPNEVLFFMGHFPFEPSFVVDIEGYWGRKLEALGCFKSQFHQEGSDDLPTGISQPDFFDRIEGRARHYGAQIGRSHGEPFYAMRVVPVDDLVDTYAPFTKIYSSREWEEQQGRKT